MLPITVTVGANVSIQDLPYKSLRTRLHIARMHQVVGAYEAPQMYVIPIFRQGKCMEGPR